MNFVTPPLTASWCKCCTFDNTVMMKISLVGGWVGHLTPRPVQTCSTNGTIVVLPPVLLEERIFNKSSNMCVVLLLVVI